MAKFGLSRLAVSTPVGVTEVLAAPEQAVASVDGKGVGQAVAEVQSRGATAALAAVPVGLPGEPLLVGVSNYATTSKRLHSALGYCAPDEVDQEWRAWQKAI